MWNDPRTLAKIVKISRVIWLVSTIIFILSIACHYTQDWSAGTYQTDAGSGYYFGTCYADDCYTTIEIERYEDGSGRVTYCLAGQACH